MRSPRVSILVVAAAALAPAAVQAKMPPFTVELDPGRPVVGQPVILTVRVGTSLAGFPDRMQDLLALERSGASIPVVLRRSGDVYRGAVVVPEAGRWTLRLFPAAFPRPDPEQLARLGYRVPSSVEVVEGRPTGRAWPAVIVVARAIAAAARAVGP